MSSPNGGSPVQPAPKPPTSILAELRYQLRPLLLAVPVLTLLTGVLFPAVLAALARPLFHHQADGSLVKHQGVTAGSALIGQKSATSGTFHPRPSAADYVPTDSKGSNLRPGSKELLEDVERRARDYRAENGLEPDAPVPVDAVTSSASGLDPHISPANAALQVPRVARERGLPEDAVRALVAEHTEGRQFWFLGEPRVNVLRLNLALQGRPPSSPPAR